VACYSSGERVDWPGMPRRGASGAADMHRQAACGMPRRGASGAARRATCAPQATNAHCFSPSSMMSLPFYLVSDEVEKVCKAVEFRLLFDESAGSYQGHSISSSAPDLLRVERK
jgi:hypothetical protein